MKISQLAYKIPPLSASTQRVQEIVGSDEVKAKVASSLAVFCRQAHGIGSGANNEYLVAIEQVRELEAFAAVVYSSNFEVEAPEFMGGRGVSVGVGQEQEQEQEQRQEQQQQQEQQQEQGQEIAEAKAEEHKEQVEEEEGGEKIELVGGGDGIVAGEEQAGVVESNTEGSFESAWDKALKKEDGKPH